MIAMLEIGHRTDVGRQRANNEDYFGIFLPHSPEEEDRRGVLLVVADGMGGYAGGEIASRSAVEALGAAYYEDGATNASEALTRAMRRANEAVLEAASRDAESTGMGSTMAAAVVRNGELTVTNVGDCRVYLLHRGQLSQLTRDHSLVAELVAAGQITVEEARHHPMRNVVTRSMGTTRELEVDAYPSVKIEVGDTILLCSDGLWGMLPAAQVREILGSRSPQAAVDALVVEANNAGGHDNITAIVCRVMGNRLDAGDVTTQLIDDASTQLMGP